MKKISCLLLCLLLTGCSLARPEADAGRDRFAGFYVVRESSGDRSDFWSSDNPLLTEYGSQAVKTDKYGTFDLPNHVLFAEMDGPNYIFPGLEDGYSLFMVHKTEDYGEVTEVVSNMGPHEEGMTIHSADDTHTETASGIIYCGPPLGAENWDQWTTGSVWTAYRVYQTEDGRVYLDGSGNRFGGDGGFTYRESRDWTATVDGTTSTERLEVVVTMETVPRLEKLVVTQFDGENNILQAGDLALREDLPEVECRADAAWVLVEEFTSEGVARTAYSVPGEGEEPASHQVVLLDQEGLGHLVYLRISGVTGSTKTA